MAGFSLRGHWLLGMSALVGILTSGEVRAQGAAASPPLRWTHDDSALSWSPCPPLFPQGCEVTVLHGDPGTGPSDVFLRVASSYVLPAHSHTSAEHLVLLEGVLEVSYAGGRRFELREGTYALVPPKTGHKARCAPGSRCVMFIRFDSPIDATDAPDIP